MEVGSSYLIIDFIDKVNFIESLRNLLLFLEEQFQLETVAFNTFYYILFASYHQIFADYFCSMGNAKYR